MIEWYWSVIAFVLGITTLLTIMKIWYMKIGSPRGRRLWPRKMSSSIEVVEDSPYFDSTGTHPGGVSYVLPEQFSPARKFDRDRKEGVEMRSASRGEEPRKR